MKGEECADRIIAIPVIDDAGEVRALRLGRVIHGAADVRWFAVKGSPHNRWVALVPSETQLADAARHVPTAANGAQFQMLGAAVEPPRHWLRRDVNQAVLYAGTDERGLRASGAPAERPGYAPALGDSCRRV